MIQQCPSFVLWMAFLLLLEQERIIRQSPGLSMNPVRLGDEYWVQSQNRRKGGQRLVARPNPQPIDSDF
ncbi:hypothetical protein SAMD00079811_62580 [Scytonema sp. HK-05]|nr:hypothetical protein SAMD00079811_62580 [Scytonema sp. HK-05]